jgi:hypothetical protein
VASVKVVEGQVVVHARGSVSDLHMHATLVAATVWQGKDHGRERHLPFQLLRNGVGQRHLLQQLREFLNKKRRGINAIVSSGETRRRRKEAQRS